MQNTAYLIWKAWNWKSQNWSLGSSMCFSEAVLISFVMLNNTNKKSFGIRNAWNSRLVRHQTRLRLWHITSIDRSALDVQLAGPTVRQLGFFLSSWLSVKWEPFSFFPSSMFTYLIVYPWWYIGYVRKPPWELNIFFFVWQQQTLGRIFCSIINLSPSVLGLAF